MRTSPLTTIYDNWTQPSYEISVRGTVYLWGSAGVTKNINLTNRWSCIFATTSSAS